MSEQRSHLMIPDLQIGPGTPTQHLAWIGQYIVDRKPSAVIQIGDLWDLPSLNRHHGKLEMEGCRYVEDVESGNAGPPALRGPAEKAGVADEIEWHLLDGNHEEFIDRAIEDDPRLQGTISRADLKAPGWKRHRFLVPVDIDGVVYAHYFYQPLTGNPYTGTVDNRLKQIGHSFSMGHQQVLMHSIRFVNGRAQHGLVAGSCYLHDEKYKGPQGNAHWRGVIVKHQVRDGAYDPMFVSLDYLCRRYEGMSLRRFKKLNKIRSMA